MSYVKTFLQENPDRATVITIPQDSDNVTIATVEDELLYILEDFHRRHPGYCRREPDDRMGRTRYTVGSAALLMFDAIAEVTDRLSYGI